MARGERGRRRRSASGARARTGSDEDGTTPEGANWTIELWEDADGHCPFAESVARLDPYRQAIIAACISQILGPLGPNVSATEWGKALGQGLYELRIRRSLHAIRTWGQSDPPPASSTEERQPVLLRVFFSVYGDRVVLLFQTYDKGAGPSDKRQQKEIAEARRHLRAWRASR